MTVLDTVYLNGCNYQIGYNLVSQSVDNNTSKVKFYGVLNVTNNYISWSSGTARVWDTTVSIGTYYSKGSYTLVSKTVTLTHNSSTGKYSTTVTGALNTTFVSGSCSGTMTLPTIPRMTKLANQTLTIGQLKNITWTRASSSFTHALSYTFGSVTETIGTNLTTSVNFTPSEELYKEMTTSSSKTGTLTLTTYSNNGNTRIGSSTATLTLKADSSVVQPVLNESYVRDVNTKTIALTGDNNVMISNHSVPFVELNFDTIQYAKVKTITVNGSNLDLPDGVTTEETPDITNYTLQQQLPVATTNTFNIVVTDSRGIQTTHIITTDFVDYIPLDCNSNFKRTSPTTGEISANFTGNYFNGSFGEVNNSLNISYAYKIQNEEEYSDLFELVENTDYKINGNMFYSGDGEDVSDIILGERLDYRNVYTLTMYVEDVLTKLVINVTIIKGIPIMWWNSEKVTINGELYLADGNGENTVQVKKEMFEENQTINANLSIKTSASANGWNALANDYKKTLPAGEYLFIFHVTVYPSDSTQTGLCSFDPYVDTGRNGDRSTIPLSKNLFSSSILSFIATFENDIEHTINLYVYSTIAIKIGNVRLQIKKLR